MSGNRCGMKLEWRCWCTGIHLLVLSAGKAIDLGIFIRALFIQVLVENVNLNRLKSYDIFSIHRNDTDFIGAY